jgi:hypothetical protein
LTGKALVEVIFPYSSPCFTPVCLNVTCQYTPVLNLRPLIFGLTPFGWLRSITLTPTYVMISYGSVIFDLRIFDVRPPLLIHKYGVRQGLGVVYEVLACMSNKGVAVLFSLNNEYKVEGKSWKYRNCYFP